MRRRTVGGPVSQPSLCGNVDLLTWFGEDERQVCESCGDRSAVSLQGAVAWFCLRCGAISIDGHRIDVEGQLPHFQRTS
jgi:hypothetical protein